MPNGYDLAQIAESAANFRVGLRQHEELFARQVETTDALLNSLASMFSACPEAIKAYAEHPAALASMRRRLAVYTAAVTRLERFIVKATSEHGEQPPRSGT